MTAGTKAARTRCGADKLLYSDLYYVFEYDKIRVAISLLRA